MTRPIVGFEHLHLHSDLSLLDGFGKASEYGEHWKGKGDYLCISDHGMMAVIPQQIRTCEINKLTPIFASELYVNPLQIECNNKKELENYMESLCPEDHKFMRRSFHLLAIAYNDIGYSNLVTLTSLAWTKGHYYRPRVNHQQLMQYKEGIVFSSCCYASEIGQAFDRGGDEEGFRMIEKYMAMFGTNFRLEIMLLDFHKQKPYDAFIVRAHDKYGIPIWVTNDCFVADTQVLTDIGPKSIQDIEIGDNVLTHKGHYKPVVFKNQRYLNKNEMVYRVVAKLGSYCFEATGNHPVLLDNGAWVKVENLKPGDKLVISKPPRQEENDGFVQNIDLLDLLPPSLSRLHYNNEKHAFVTGRRNIVCIPRYLPIDTDLLFILGMYIAEGHVYSNAEVGFASHTREIKEREILERYFLKFGIHVNHDLRGENGRATRFSSVIFKAFFEILCGKGASNKYLPPLKFSKSQLAILLKAYINGDGHLRKLPFRQLMIPTTSLKLVEQIRAIICSWGIPVIRTERNYRKKSQKHKNKNAKPSQWKTLYVINLSGDKLRNFEKCLDLDFNIDKFDFTTSVKSIFPIDYNLKVYNLQVLEDETYTANGWVVHNCHFCKAEHSKFQRLMLMVQTKLTIKDIERKIQESGDQDLFVMQDPNLHMKTEEEITLKWETDYSHIIPYELFEQAKKNTVEMCRMASGVTLDRSMKLPIWPDANDRLKEEVIRGFKRKGLPFTKEYQSRLREELDLICEKNFSSYFLILKATVDEARRYSMEVFGTPNAVGPGRGSDVGSFVCFLLGITTVNPLKHGLLFSRFLSKSRKDWPDADVDFIPQVRDYLKNDWAPKYFGQEKVCNIGSYNTFGIKSSLIDMARVHDKDRYEILNLTTKIGLKDEDGNIFTWEKALEAFPELKKYCEDNPDVAESARMMIGRSRSMGKHAGGIVISSEPINKYVPLVRGHEGEPVSAWTQGLHDQDLEPMGFIKYDWLVITNLLQINYACKLIKERHGLKGVWAKEEQEDFSDDNFICDAKAIAMANDANLKGVFQFDSEGIRSLVKKAGIDRFDDLVAITALYRPGPMGEGQHDEFVARKRGEKPYDLHPLLQPILGNTYGVICYQEECMKIFNVVGNIPLEHCYNLIKAISKKKKEIFGDYKVQFIENGQKNLGWTLEEVEALWKQLEGFAGYAFNLSHAVAYTYISFMLLVLKAHYPLEFFTSILHYESNADKMKEYKCDAEMHEVKMEALDLNKSKVYFDITDDKIYFGFANVKGIGERIANKIVANQPYVNLSDFLTKFGMDESVIKPLIGLGLFTKDGKPETLYKYYRWYKDIRAKREARKKRFDAACKKYMEETESVKEMELSDEERSQKFAEINKKVDRSVAGYHAKPTIEDPIPPLSDFLLEQTLRDVAEITKEPEIDEKLYKLLNNSEECEQMFYGFLWHHPVKNSPDYEGKRTFELFRERGEAIGYVEVMVRSTARQTSKKKKDVHYWLLKAEDENGEENLIQVWQDDWDRFGDEFKERELVKIKIKAPDKGFHRYTLWSPPKWPKWEYDKLIPKDRTFDLRVVVLRKAELIK